jgi:hypothetical protein
MTTVARRVIATPVRSAPEAWDFIVKLLAPHSNSIARQELSSIVGIACALIADEAMKTVPIVVFGSGPRVRIYCLYNEDAITGEDSKEDDLPYNATEGDWHMSLPCPKDDLNWVQASLKKLSTRVTARDMSKSDEAEDAEGSATMKSFEIDKEAFFRT